jgi:glycosyltransferase involved in cell wall biosynthesis
LQALSYDAATATDSRRTGLRVAMALYGDLTHDSRVQREATTLSQAGHTVTVYCLGGTVADDAPFRVERHKPDGTSVLPDGSSPFLASSSRGLVGRVAARVRWLVGYARTLRTWGRLAVEAAGPVDVWHAHDLTGLVAVAPLVRKPTRLVYDSHEIFLESGTGARLPRPIRRLMSLYERRLVSRAVALVTVNEGCAAVLERRLRPLETVIVRNCPPRWEPSAETSRLREATGVLSSQPLLLYHGAFMADRGIEELVEAMMLPGLDTAHLALLGYGPARPRLDELARDGRFAGRLHVLDAVVPNELLGWVAGADVNVMPIQRSTLNHWLGTPNRLWESLAAGIPVVASNFPVMRRVILEDPAGPLGAVCDPSLPTSIAAATRTIIEASQEAREALRSRCLRAAHERWNWEAEGARLLDLYTRMQTTDSRPGRTTAT